MATGTGRFSIGTGRGRPSRNFHFTFGPQVGWLFRLAAIPIAIAAVILGLFSMVILGLFSIAILMGALVFLALAFAIRGWRLRVRRRSAAKAGDILETAPVHRLPARENAPRLKGPAGSPQ